MTAFETLKIVVRSLKRAPMRSGLTTLGVVVGVSSVIAMTSIGNGAKKHVESLLSAVDASHLLVVAIPNRDRWADNVPPELEYGDGITLPDAMAVQKSISGAATTGIHVRPRAPSKVGTTKAEFATMINGTDRDGLRLLGRTVLSGHSFSEADLRRSARVVVLSESLAVSLFGTLNPSGRNVRVGSEVFVVIGVVKSRAVSLGVPSSSLEDVAVFAPYTTVLRRIDRNSRVSIMVRAHDPSQLAEIEQRVANVMEERRGGRKVEFATTNIAAALSSYKDGSRAMTQLLGAVAAVSLVVGGIGIMNILLANVSERTREIGVRMALGTRRQDILALFLLEATILSSCGGVLGVGLGVAVSGFLSFMNGWPTELAMSAVLVAVLCSSAIGIIFGFRPAVQAAALQPVRALRID